MTKTETAKKSKGMQILGPAKKVLSERVLLRKTRMSRTFKYRLASYLEMMVSEIAADAAKYIDSTDKKVLEPHMLIKSMHENKHFKKTFQKTKFLVL